MAVLAGRKKGNYRGGRRSRSRNPSRRRKGLAERQGVGVAVAPIYFIYKNRLAESEITSRRVKNQF